MKLTVRPARASDRSPKPARCQYTVWLVIAAGVLLRVRAYLFNRSLWLDEAMLALNITQRSYASLLEPLDRQQAAPLGFLMVERAVVDALGGSEYSLRLFPLACGLASLGLMWKLSARVLPYRAAALALGLCAISPLLIYYSSEVKQYATDVTIALLVWWLALEHEAKGFQGRAGWLGMALVGAGALWLSHPIVFVLASVGLRWTWVTAKASNWADFYGTLFLTLLWAASFLLVYQFSLQTVSGNVALREFWSDAFAPLPPTSVNEVRWYIVAISRLVDWPLGNDVGQLVLFSGILGASVMYGRNRGHLFVLVFPAVLALLACGLGKYPFTARLWLFLIPSTLIMVAAGTEEFWRRAGGTWPLAAIVLSGLLLGYPTLNAVHRFAKPQEVEEARPLLAYLHQNRRDGDALYLYYGAIPATSYYAESGVVALDGAVEGVSAREDLARYLASLDRFLGQGRVWFLFSHVNVERGLDEAELALMHLDTFGTRVVDRRVPGARLVLYHFD